MYKDGGILMQIFFIKKKSTSDHDADDHNGKPPPPHTLCGGEVSLRRLQEMGREWEGIGRGIRSRPPNIPRSIPRSKVNRIFLGDKIKYKNWKE